MKTNSKLSCVLAASILLLSSGPSEGLGQTARESLKVETRSGVLLHTEVFLPQGKGPYPTVLLRTPYSKWLKHETDKVADNLTTAGFACVVQDCRGTGDSSGEWYPYRNEAADGVDTLRWTKEQRWCDGSIGLYGDSYLGYTHYALAGQAGQSVKAGYAHVPTFDWYETTYLGGAMRLDARVTWNTWVARPKRNETPLIDGDLRNWNWDASYWHLPLLHWDNTVGNKITWMRDSVEHPERDTYWQEFDIVGDLKNTAIPNLIVTGWYDIFLDQAFRYSSEIREQSKIQTARRHQHVVIGPWGHIPNENAGARDFGGNATRKLDELMVKWYARWLNDEKNGIQKLPNFQLFVMGANRWRTSSDWPLKETKWTRYYLHSMGAANSLEGNGTLSTKAPADEPPDHFKYDPTNPVPTNGGEWRLFAPWGARDQRPIERRDDVLVYTSQPLTEPLEVTGPIRVVLHAATNAKDTDWTAKLVDVYPDGRAFNLCDGIIRARYRDPEQGSKLLEPDNPYRYEIDLWATSNEFQPGHRIRLEVSSSNFPRFDRNPNTGAVFGKSTELKTAEQSVFHDETHASYVLLPVIPR